ncbi:hypothetical protein B0H14DRAFT_3045062 [Mycena olivaceomarginata]|nr:hypothetical protein B0H14DRAFT_3045062 [Mycena olivaceomarginata]
MTPPPGVSVATSKPLPEFARAKQLPIPQPPDIQAWLRSKRLHKYSGCFEGISWDDMLKLTESDLKDRGVYTVGARGRLMKFLDEAGRGHEGRQAQGSNCTTSIPSQGIIVKNLWRQPRGFKV